MIQKILNSFKNLLLYACHDNHWRFLVAEMRTNFQICNKLGVAIKLGAYLMFK